MNHLIELLKKKSAASGIPAEVCASAFGPGLNPPLVESFSKFDSRQLSSPLNYRPQIFSNKNLNPFLIVTKFQETGSILRMGFAMSRWPHFHWVYSVTVCNQNLMAVSDRYLHKKLWKQQGFFKKKPYNLVIKNNLKMYFSYL